jgi:hypothetical protein
VPAEFIYVYFFLYINVRKPIRTYIFYTRLWHRLFINYYYYFLVQTHAQKLQHADIISTSNRSSARARTRPGKLGLVDGSDGGRGA